MFWIDISMSCSGRFVIVSSSSPMTSEVHLIDLESTKPAALTLVEPREQDHLYRWAAPRARLSRKLG